MESDSTCWTVIHEAASGRQTARDEFARRYDPVVRAYLGHRWRQTPFYDDIDDAAQEVFVECFRQGGVLDRADPDRAGGFRAFLYGVLRNVALRVETRRARKRENSPGSEVDLRGVEQDETSLSRVFDRAWAKALLREATAVQAERAREAGETAMRRVELLRFRFQNDLPIREIARLWGMDAAVVHKEYVRARDEFRQALVEVVSFHRPGTPGEIERECADLLSLFE